LEKGIQRLVGDTQLKDKIYQHPLIKNLALTDNQKPSYIPADTFALALMDIITGPERAASDGEALRQGLVAMATSRLKQALGVALQSQNPKLITDQEKIEDWFNGQMDRVSGWYKRATQNRVLLLALVVTIALNADTTKVTRLLWTNPAVTATLVETAKDRLAKGRPDVEPRPMVEYENPNDPTASKPINVPQRDTLSDQDRKVLGELTGWGDDWIVPWARAHEGAGKGAWLAFVLYAHALGWVITVIAVSLGAPFWFDTLNQFMNIRGAGRAPDEPRDKSSATS
jgi:hypothetical protein